MQCCINNQHKKEWKENSKFNWCYFKRCVIVAFIIPALWIVSSSVSSLFGNVVDNENFWAAYWGLALKFKKKIQRKTEIFLNFKWNWHYVVINNRKSAILCDKLKRPVRRLPSDNLIWIEVIGWLESKLIISLALFIERK